MNRLHTVTKQAAASTTGDPIIVEPSPLTAEDFLRNEDLVLLLPLPAKSLGIYFALLQQHQKGI